ncbi:MAG: hypothetical protein ACLP01_26855 [Solirubrobacteraceae bacterium]
MQLPRARGIESEAQIPFASLFELIRPALDAFGADPGAPGCRARPISGRLWCNGATMLGAPAERLEEIRCPVLLVGPSGDR